MMTPILPLPAASDEITPEWLTAALRAGGVLPRGEVTAARVEIIGEAWGFTGVVCRVRPWYAGVASHEHAPPSLIAKLPTAERPVPSHYRATQQRDAAAERANYERSAREVRFYHEIAPAAAVPAPRLYFGAADDETGRVVLLLEDFAGARVGDALAGCTAEDAARVLEAMAPVQARWWAHADADAFPWLPRWTGDYEARQERYARQVGPFLERFGDRLPPPIRDLVDQLRTRYAAVLATLDQAPKTVIHADLHLDNVLFKPLGREPPVVVIDWQGICRGPAAVDIALFVFGSLAVETRRAVEDDLFRRYHALLVAHGVSGYSLERLRDDCRLALLRQLAGTVGWLAGADLDRLHGRERALVEAAIGDGRLVAALLDLDVASLLPR